MMVVPFVYINPFPKSKRFNQKRKKKSVESEKKKNRLLLSHFSFSSLPRLGAVSSPFWGLFVYGFFLFFFFNLFIFWNYFFIPPWIFLSDILWRKKHKEKKEKNSYIQSLGLCSCFVSGNMIFERKGRNQISVCLLTMMAFEAKTWETEHWWSFLGKKKMIQWKNKEVGVIM